jgi:pimeloyl-ACP methyl ester carboxylesterase
MICDNGLFWLDELASGSCREMNFAHFPKTVIVHGKNDKVVDMANASELAKHIPHSQLIIWPDCGHAPHLHNPDALRDLINNYV